MSFEWHTYLCDYFNVTKEEALRLGTRSSGRKPNLPGIEKCQSVSNMTYEDIWSSSKRKTIEDIFKFYRDQGAWSTFRQCVRHKDMEDLHVAYFEFLIQNNLISNNSHVCEYGSGVAPFTTSFLKYVELPKDIKINFSLVDVDCNHLDFAEYRLNKIVKDFNLNDNVELKFFRVEPNKLPDFSFKKLDVVFCFEVLEHVPSPVSVINNIKDNMNKGGIYVENFIKHEPGEEDDDDGPDLISAREERKEYYEIVNKYFNLISPSLEESNNNPNHTRIWQRNSL